MRPATLLALGAAFLAAIDTLLVKSLSRDIHAFEIAFLRSLFGLFAVLPWLMLQRVPLTVTRLSTHFIRATVKYASMIAFFVALANAPVADVTAIALTAPLLSIAGAWMFLKERSNINRMWIALLGLAGALIITQPGFPHSNSYLFLAFGGAVGLSSVMLLLKHITDTDSAEAVLFWNLVLTVAISFIPSLFVWKTPEIRVIILLVLQGAISALGILMMARAIRLSAVSQIASLDFLRLPAVAILAYLFFGETYSIASWLGGGMIIISCLLLGFQNARPRT